MLYRGRGKKPHWRLQHLSKTILQQSGIYIRQTAGSFNHIITFTCGKRFGLVDIGHITLEQQDAEQQGTSSSTHSVGLPFAVSVNIIGDGNLTLFAVFWMPVSLGSWYSIQSRTLQMGLNNGSSCEVRCLLTQPCTNIVKGDAQFTL